MTPRTDAAEAEYFRWLEYARRNKPFAEAMEQAPKEADPFHVARELERELIENEGVIAVWRGRTERAEAELARALRVVEAARQWASAEVNGAAFSLRHEVNEWEAGR